jgi:RNA polymerase sigma-70 factor (ECF subfamily)
VEGPAPIDREADKFSGRPNLDRASSVSSECRAIDDDDPPPARFDAVFRDHYWPMVSSLALACGNREVAADAVQEAFTRAYARWWRISRYDDPVSWIRHVALNRTRDHYRSEVRARRAVERLAGRALEHEAAPELADPTLAATIGRLPRQQRIAVSLFYVEQLSVAEVAASMRLSEGAVKYHLHAGRAALRGWIEAG